MKTLDKLALIILTAGAFFLVMNSMKGMDPKRRLDMKYLKNRFHIYDASDELEKRARIIAGACQNSTKLRDYKPVQAEGTEKWMYNAFLASQQKSLIYCPVPKCGWSSWRQMFFQALHPEGSEAILNDMAKTGWLTPWELVGMSIHNLFESDELIKSNFKHRLIFVRNPFDRLVSAYKDKVLRDNGAYIIQNRRPCDWVTKDNAKLTFSQFIQCIIDKVKKHSSNDLSRFDAGEVLDMHWRPQTLLCNVCTIKYNIVGHFDHMSQDMEAALDILKMEAKAAWSNVAKTDKPFSEWYNQLSDAQISDLMLLYKYDIELLGFDVSSLKT